ncbi:hypothetical protein [Streptomyces sp. AM6-12]|uniref:hypothetical protein n=1 Tax=Streptomyces sp. AM6-12 TaxID=3345149 RepID=UPI00379EB500
MNELWNNFLYGLLILAPGGLLGAAIAYLTTGTPIAGPGTRVWRPRRRLRRPWPAA